MPGFTIHLAIGKRYIDKHKNQIKNEEEFIKGIMAPDLNKEMTEIEKDKSKSHYGIWGNYNVTTNIDKFLKDEKVNIEQDYWKGYFLHLITDHYFYSVDFINEFNQTKKNNENLYNDYDCLNATLRKDYMIDKYKIDAIEKYMYIIEKEPKYLKLEKVEKFIEKISSFDIKDTIKIIEEKGMEGLK